MSNRVAVHARPSVPEVIDDIRKEVGQFELNPHQMLGDADSGHEVLFGSIDNEQVAVKPFVKEQKALHELGMIEEVSKRGFETLDPLYVGTGGLYTYLITARRKHLNHLGQENWSSGIASKHLKKTLEPRIDFAGETISDLSQKGIIVGDFQPKNVIYDWRTGEPVVIDLEGGAVDQPRDVHAHRLDTDLTRFGKELFYRGFLSDRTPQYRSGWLLSRLVEPVLDVEMNGKTGTGFGFRIEKIGREWEDTIKKIERRIPRSNGKRRKKVGVPNKRKLFKK